MIDKPVNQHSATLEGLNQNVNDLRGLVEDVLVTVNEFADQTQKRFEKIECTMATKEDLVGFATKEDLSGFATKEDLSGFATKEDFAKMETRLVTKDYLDVKMSDLRGDLVVMMRKGDTKLKALVGVLENKKVIDENDVKKIYSLEPFAQ